MLLMTDHQLLRDLAEHYSSCGVNVVLCNTQLSELHSNDLTEPRCRWHATRAADLSSQYSLVLDVSSPPPQVAKTEDNTSYGQGKPTTMRHLVQVSCKAQATSVKSSQIDIAANA